MSYFRRDKLWNAYLQLQKFAMHFEDNLYVSLVSICIIVWMILYIYLSHFGRVWSTKYGTPCRVFSNKYSLDRCFKLERNSLRDILYLYFILGAQLWQYIHTFKVLLLLTGLSGEIKSIAFSSCMSSLACIMHIIRITQLIYHFHQRPRKD